MMESFQTENSADKGALTVDKQKVPYKKIKSVLTYPSPSPQQLSTLFILGERWTGKFK